MFMWHDGFTIITAEKQFGGCDLQESETIKSSYTAKGS